ncbi:DUF4286 family protein [Bradyrhizobium sp. NAS80.1]|uniref:DUF4286 family protein n=1 Tax=Bradyrhizobium sp. NAS80.1 TaxID=1680159 RepID=UPI0011610E76|nr:DUF4286 family protein [Bradyrhizobium sp. NAS80.1]
MPLPENLLIVEAVIDPSVEDQWNRWYDEVHLPEIVDCPGFRSGQRYVSESDEGRTYVSVYELDAPEALKGAEFASRRGWGPFGSQVKFKTRLYTRRSQILGE